MKNIAEIDNFWFAVYKHIKSNYAFPQDIKLSVIRGTYKW